MEIPTIKQRPAHPDASVYLEIFRGRIEQYADEWAREYVAPALAGNEEAAFALAAALSSKKRGVVTVAFWRAKAPRTAFRQLLSIAWSHDHAELVKAAGSRRRLSAIFRYAQFSTEGLPRVVQVWRGASGGDVSWVARGFSWTLDRDVACWFAMRRAGVYGSPLVLRAEVPREAVALHDNERGENEVVLVKAPGYAIDGNEDEWHMRYQLFEHTKNAREGHG